MASKTHLFVLVIFCILAGCGDTAQQQGETSCVGFDGSTCSPVEQLLYSYGYAVDPVAAELEFQEKIQSCMKAEGFDYVVFVSESPSAGRDQPSEVLIVERFRQSREEGFDSLHPNDELLRNMNPPEADSWRQALDGDPADNDSDGCWNQATKAMLPSDLEGLVDLQSSLGDLEVMISSDARTIDLDDKWSKCMRDEGLKFQNPTDIDVQINMEIRSLIGEPSIDRGVDSESFLDEIEVREREYRAASALCIADQAEERRQIEDEYQTKLLIDSGFDASS